MTDETTDQTPDVAPEPEITEPVSDTDAKADDQAKGYRGATPEPAPPITDDRTRAHQPSA